MTDPLILTAHVSDEQMAPFDQLRQRHFPAKRNFLRAHVTMFHHLPGEHLDEVGAILASTAAKTAPIPVEVSGLRYLGAGVAFSLTSPALQELREQLRQEFKPWLKPQDMQKWQPHITVQNKVGHADADILLDMLQQDFQPWSISVSAVDLWRYLGGPWQLQQSIRFEA